ncbi:MAG TPA: NADP-dependent malic enzyme [Kiritimatiellae bacterium]|nr:NADP-dependent malic enzyme [Kiritimatiellia bacterium]
MNAPDTHRQEAEAATRPMRMALKLHPFYRGKIQTAPRCPVRSLSDFAYWYTPGVAASCRAIAENPDEVFRHTSRWNTIAVVSDGSRVLGLGNIGPQAALPVMEGKALIFKYLGGVDAVPLVISEKDPSRMIELVLAIQPSFGGINLEDIAQPKCFTILDQLRARAAIPVWHDDQQGTATVILAGLTNAMRIVGKELPEVRIVFLGSGASNTAAARLIFARGADPGRCVVVDSKGILGTHRRDIYEKRKSYAIKWHLCRRTNREGKRGGLGAALEGADVLIACSRPGPGIVRPEWIRRMADGAIVFACANPVPEIWPWEAREAGAAVVATGRSDFPNQVNNSLGFPGIFRGALDVRSRSITDTMCFAAADALADYARDRGLQSDRILPTMEDWEVFVEEAAAVGTQACREGLARIPHSADELRASARQIIGCARRMTGTLMDEGIIPPPPPED